jgi:hypothetical protein
MRLHATPQAEGARTGAPSSAQDYDVDVAIVGAGPAGSAMVSTVCSSGGRSMRSWELRTLDYGKPWEAG